MRRVVCMLLALILCMVLPMAAFAATESSAESGTPVVTTGTNPKTGDIARMDIWVPVLIISAVALAVVLVIYFKKFRKTN